ncbi:M20/M25/M40 family metallo-hydrolase [Psychroflexus tropicus]|uniref:M20/M25/M40 family metallo-hydrolase n=1 Tax=Psychroflexus tropicus TaxID=197345 RepID=UPI0003670C88|nr:M20/M25/M40 family metallo-hydrolase [Psychroflexus tropicus]
MKSFFIALAFLFTAFVCAQTPNHEELQKLTYTHLNSSIALLKDWLSLPNNGSVKEDIRNNLEYAEEAFGSRGFTTNILSTEATPLLLAEKKIDKDLPVLLVYAHADGQPVDKNLWDQPDPYLPVLKQKDETGNWEIITWSSIESKFNPDWRIFGRSTSDDKGPIAMLWTAIDIIEESDLRMKVNLKVIIDFEEELGSPNLPQAVDAYKADLAADMLVIIDGPQHSTNQPTLSFGARGIQMLTLKTYGAYDAQHSGHYGNYITNPARQMAQLLASFYDENGRVAIPGYYDGVELTKKELKALQAVPDDEEKLTQDLGIITKDRVADFLQASIQYPSLNIRGLSSGWVEDEARTIVPNLAIAELDIRLVKSSEPERLINLIKSHIEAQGYSILEEAPSAKQRQDLSKIVQFNYNFAYDAFKTDTDAPIGLWLISALERAFNTAPVIIPTSGGSIPISPFVSALSVPAVTVPLVNSDNNQHSPNENLRLGHYRDGIISIMAILTEAFEN